MTKLWFAAKRYGYGWYPVSWEGWVTLLIFLILVFIPIGLIGLYGFERFPEKIFLFYYLPYEFALVVLLIWICAKKGEKARWRWGK